MDIKRDMDGEKGKKLWLSSLSIIQNECKNDEKISIKGSQMGGDGMVGDLLGKSGIAVNLIGGTLIEDGY
jgi:hypothetical protein